MADIFSGKNVKIYYNVDTGNRAVVTAGNIEISQLAQYPSFSMGNEVAKIETYNDEYANAITGQQTVDEIEIVITYQQIQHINSLMQHMTMDRNFKSPFSITKIWKPVVLRV